MSTSGASVSRRLRRLFGISTSASAKDVKAAFRQLALRWHPDVNPDPAAAAKFIEISTAYGAHGRRWLPQI